MSSLSVTKEEVKEMHNDSKVYKFAGKLYKDKSKFHIIYYNEIIRMVIFFILAKVKIYN